MKQEFDDIYVSEAVDAGEYDYEGDMAKTQLVTIADAAEELHDMLEDDENLPEWCQNKITKAMDYLDTVRDYMIAKDTDEEPGDENPNEAVVNEGNMASAAKELEAYARKSGGIDKNDFIKAAMMMKRNQKKQLDKFVDELDTEPREKIQSVMQKHIKEAYSEPQGQAKRLMSPLQKMRMDKEKKDRDRDGKLKPGVVRRGKSTMNRLRDIQNKSNVMALKSSKEQVEEAKLSDAEKSELEDLILGLKIYSDPYSMNPQYKYVKPTLDKIKKKFGDKIYNDLKNAVQSGNWHSPKYGMARGTYASDRLAWKKPTTIKKDGKIDARSAKSTKRSIKYNLKSTPKDPKRLGEERFMRKLASESVEEGGMKRIAQAQGGTKSDRSDAAVNKGGLQTFKKKPTNEKLKVSDGMSAWIDDFKQSDAPQFKGKTAKERRDMAIAAYLSAKDGGKNEDV